MGEAFIAEMPRCPVHGQMTYEPLRNLWRCHGWDGEGCDHMVPAEDVPWTRLGSISDLTIDVGSADPRLVAFPAGTYEELLRSKSVVAPIRAVDPLGVIKYPAAGGDLDHEPPGAADSTGGEA